MEEWLMALASETEERCLMVNRTIVVCRLVVIGSALTILTDSFSGNVPLLHTSTQCPGMSLHVISFTRPSLALVLQATNTMVRRPGYIQLHQYMV